MDEKKRFHDFIYEFKVRVQLVQGFVLFINEILFYSDTTILRIKYFVIVHKLFLVIHHFEISADL